MILRNVGWLFDGLDGKLYVARMIRNEWFVYVTTLHYIGPVIVDKSWK